MPLYEYACKTCKIEFEQITSMGDPDQGKCPKCKTKNTEKLVSRFAVKGRGDQRESTFHGCHDHYTGVSDDTHHSHDHSDHPLIADPKKKEVS